jgi:hypothetical protein
MYAQDQTQNGGIAILLEVQQTPMGVARTRCNGRCSVVPWCFDAMVHPVASRDVVVAPPDCRGAHSHLLAFRQTSP